MNRYNACTKKQGRDATSTEQSKLVSGMLWFSLVPGTKSILTVCSTFSLFSFIHEYKVMNSDHPLSPGGLPLQKQFTCLLGDCLEHFDNFEILT